MDIDFPIDYGALNKRYYTISEVAELFNVAPSLIRYWESEIKQLKPAKTRSGNRKFTVDDIRTIEQIKNLVKQRGFTLEGAEKELDDELVRNRLVAKRIGKLEEIKARLIQISETLDHKDGDL